MGIPKALPKKMCKVMITKQRLCFNELKLPVLDEEVAFPTYLTGNVLP